MAHTPLHYTTLHWLHRCVQPVKSPSCTLSVTFPLHRCYSPYGTPPTPLSTVNMPAGCSHNNMTEQASLRQQHTHERREDTHSMLKRAPRMRIQEKVPSLKPSGAPLTWHILLPGPACATSTVYLHWGISAGSCRQSVRPCLRPICSRSNCGSVRGSGRWASRALAEAEIHRRLV